MNSDRTNALRERIAEQYGVALDRVPDPRTVPQGVSGLPEKHDKQASHRIFGRQIKFQALLRREGKL